jgi:hypothetical protein
MTRTLPCSLLAFAVLCFGCSTSAAPASDPGEITEETPLLHEDGTLAAHGWARGPLMQYDRSLVHDDRAEGLREWEYYAVFAPDFAIGLTLADIGLLSFSILTLEDYETEDIHEAIMFADTEALDFPFTPFGNTSFEAQTGTVEYRFEDDLRTITVLAGEPGTDERMEAHVQLRDSESIGAVLLREQAGEHAGDGHGARR